MAKGTTALGKFRGKVGGQVLRVVKGTQVLQEYNPHPSYSRTDPQWAQRTGMAYVAHVGSLMKKVIKIGFNQNNYPFSAFIKRNLNPNVVTWVGGGDITPHPDDIVVAEKTLGAGNSINPGTPSFGAQTHLTITCPFSFASEYDTSRVFAYFVVYSRDNDKVVVSQPVAASTGSVSITLDEEWDGMEAHLYCFLAAYPNDIDPEAIEQTTQRMPIGTTESVYCGFGEMQ